MNGPKHVDLCSGIGGFTIAFESAGFRTVGFSEVEPYPCAVLKKHWPHIPNLGPVEAIDARKLLQSHGHIDVVTAGVPCQPASLAGKRRGTSDARWLWWDVLGLVFKLGPSFAVFENPTGILSLERGKCFERILGALSEGGYDCWWETVPACAVGADHRRERVIVVAHSHSIGRRRRREYSNSKASAWKEIEAMREPSSNFNIKGQPPSIICQEGRYSKGLPTPASLPWGKPESYFVRNVHGIPFRTHRIKSLGNSVVPQVIYPFAKAIFEEITQ